MFPLAGFGCRIWSVEFGVWGSGVSGAPVDWIAPTMIADVDYSMGSFGTLRNYGGEPSHLKL
ncbi:MAG: hypothetical protein CL912_01895 [Deltaproteobacteria bacterium]|nr:hypothetical protein [Deltaproteobacteria bacterium]